MQNLLKCEEGIVYLNHNNLFQGDVRAQIEGLIYVSISPGVYELCCMTTDTVPIDLACQEA